MEVILVRHTSVDVPPGTCYGQTDVPLKDTFAVEAAATRASIAVLGTPDAVFTSPLSRCVYLAEFCGYPDAVRDARLLEMNFGDWEMRLYDSIVGPEADRWYEDYINTAVPGGESFMMQYNRVTAFLDELRAKPYARVLIFAHGGVLACAKIFAGLTTPKEAFFNLTPYGGHICIAL
ncbi:MAG: alpha-ribazole phosphatase family protein [Bacteroidales bacterium]|nr:alpha-ribazole phosphatase family protein [Bacteroidales bacterium]